MRTDKEGNVVDLSGSWLQNGFGLHTAGCILNLAWNAWSCLNGLSYRRLVLESMDDDHEIRRISPVAFTSSQGFTDLLNGGMDHGWCFSYTCLKRLMTFAPIVAMGETYSVHFSGTNPQKMRISLTYASTGESVLLKIYYQSSTRLQVFVGDRFVEDVNQFEGRMKNVLVKSGDIPSNNNENGYDWQIPHLDCPCQLKTEDPGSCQSDNLCNGSPGNVHGANTFNPDTNMLEIVIREHEISEYIDIISVPSVQMSMGVSVSVDSFYEIKDAFISSISGVLGIDVNRISIVDVVPGNARRRLPGAVMPSGLNRRLFQEDQATVDMDILPVAELYISGCTVEESAGILNVSVTRSENIFPIVTVSFATMSADSDTAVAGVNFDPVDTTISFSSQETVKVVPVSIYSILGHNNDLTFSAMLSNSANAEITRARAVFRIQNVHSPPPGKPTSTLVDAHDAITILWTNPEWSSPASEDWATILEYEVQIGRVESDDQVADWNVVDPGPGTQTHFTVSSLDTYSLYKFRVRARTMKGWTLHSPPSAGIRTLAICGDGFRHASEGCDTGETVDPGCDASTCEVVTGFSCAGGSELYPDVCAEGCGDSNTNDGEECDDGNDVANDGCKHCRFEHGWSCSSSGCVTSCGDGIRAGQEVICERNSVRVGSRAQDQDRDWYALL